MKNEKKTAVSGEEKTLGSKVFSRYNGRLVVRLPIGRNAFSCGIIVLGHKLAYNEAGIRTLKHEYGHILQLKAMGYFRFIRYIAIPSMKGYWTKVSHADYYSQPWEYGADKLGGVNRNGYKYAENADIVWEEYFAKLKREKKK